MTAAETILAILLGTTIVLVYGAIAVLLYLERRDR
jgi:hypothetical protein